MSIESRIGVKAGETPLLNFGPIVGDDGLPVDLTNAQITFIIGTPDKLNIYVKKTVGAGVVILNQVSSKGVFTVQWAQFETANLNGEYYFEAEIFLSGVSSVCSFGPFDVDRSFL